ncbi:MAG: ATP-binding cassette domain-containing protein, partial [Chloroflexi bacterium]|nr:ATP-binding cassette domain-containing protein [Chloroflexota bacterium]
MPSFPDLAQFLFSGLTVGCLYALVALGFVVIANVTGVLNFAQGEYVMLGGMVTAWATAQGMSWLLAVPLAVALGAMVAGLQERATVMPLRGRTGVLPIVLASLGVGAIVRAVALLIWKADPLRAPSFFPGTFELLGAGLDNQAVTVWLTTTLILASTAIWFGRTSLGRAMRACAVNPLAARLVGVRLSTLSLLAFVLAGGMGGLVGAVTVPLTLASWSSGLGVGLVAFIAAAIGGFTSPVRAVLAGLCLGLVEALSAGLLSSNYRLVFVYGALFAFLLARDLAGPDGVVRRASLDHGGGWRAILVARLQFRDRRRLATFLGRPVLQRPDRWAMHLLPGRVLGLMLGLAALAPLALTSPRALDAAIFIALAAIGATGLGLVMGLAGQLSLGQAGFYLVSGYTAALMTARLGWDPISALVVAVGAAVLVATVVGWLTLRLQGFNLAIATLAFHLTLLVVVNQLVDLTGGPLGVTGIPPIHLFGIDLLEPRHFYLLTLMLLGICLALARNVAASAIGRALRAIAADQAGAEGVGLSTVQLKQAIFVVGAGMAGMAGVLWAYYVRLAAPSLWDVKLTLDLITFVIVGGVTSVYGGALGALVVGGLQFAIRALGISGPGAQGVEILLTGLMLVGFVLLFPEGIVGQLRTWVERVRRRKPGRPVEPATAPSAMPSSDLVFAPLSRVTMPQSPQDQAVVSVSALSRRFGSFMAVDSLDFDLLPGTITAMVGPNGSGKSTVINLMSGVLVPSHGQVRLAGQRIDGVRADEVARRGLMRTFQTPKLFPGLTTIETVMLARQRVARAGLLDAAVHSRRATNEEAAARGDATTWLNFVGLGASADIVATSLPVGHQRLVEVARVLASEPLVALLDEPAAGLDPSETRALALMISAISRAGVAVLLVEHDMSMVMSIADRVLV